MAASTNNRAQTRQRASHDGGSAAQLETALDILSNADQWPDLEDRLFEAICKWEGLIPARILRTFACDCAERALQHVRQAGLTPDPRSTNALEAQRRWLRGEATPEELAAAVKAAKCAAFASDEGAPEAASYAVCAAMTWGADDDPADVAWAAADYAEWAAQDSGQSDVEAERSWQVARLVELLRNQQHAGE